ncbi:MAG: hypothetical protein MZV64_64860 [Ignavibacteriales bacterium]|nr:hypothetical protein [Ignavibacteriales bacterium]
MPWIADNVINGKLVDTVIIKENLTAEKIIEAIEIIEKIIENPKSSTKYKLPFKNIENTYYKSNHFSGEFLSSSSKDFKFTGNIQNFTWKFKRTRLSQKPNKNLPMPRLSLRLTSIEQVKHLKNI